MQLSENVERSSFPESHPAAASVEQCVPVQVCDNKTSDVGKKYIDYKILIVVILI
jgi:hypothetical protein